jgi:DNA polymerase-1
MKKLLLIDGNSILNRAFYGMAANMLITKSGIYTNAIYGFLNILEKYMTEDKPTHIAVAFDLKAPTFRHEFYTAYKAGRKGMPPELSLQVPILKDILKAMNITMISKEGYEADDIIGTLSMSSSENMTSVILTGDRDMLQLISAYCTVKIPTVTSGKKTVNVFTNDVFRDEYGIEPQKLVDVKALMGDKSDNIPGIAGIGEVGALDLIKKYDSLENLYENIESITKPALKEKLVNDKDNAFLSKRLSKICCDAPISDILMNDLVVREINKEDLLKIFRELEFNSFIDKFGLRNVKNKDSETVSDFCISKSDDASINNSDIFISYSIKEDTLSLTYMTDDNKIFEASSFESCEVLKRITSGNNCLISHYIKDLLLYCMRNKIDIPKQYYDTATALYLLDSMKDRYDLGDIYRNLNANGRDDNPDVYKMKFLYSYTKENLNKNEMYGLYTDIELPLVEVLAFMEYIGIKADGDYLRSLSEYFNSELTVTTKEIFDYAGESFNINSPKQLGEILFGKLKLPSKGNGSTSVDILEKLREYPIVDKVLYYRTLSKLNSTYAQGLLSKIETDGRIHSNFKQTVTATGRISSTEPNLQNIPIRTEIGRKLRKAFIPSEGYTLLSGDYSQIELRVLSHIAQDSNMINAFKNDEDIHTITASEVFKTPVDKVSKAQRQAAKAVNFGIIYGISDFSLAKDINVPVSEAAQYINDYLEYYSGIRSYMTKVVQKAKADGYVTTIYGRRRYLPELNSPKFSVREFGKRVALNAPIQGSAADIIKIAMVNIYNALKDGKYKSRLILQVHDELIIETHLDEVDAVRELLTKYMTDYFKLSVPLKIDFSIGNSLLKD